MPDELHDLQMTNAKLTLEGRNALLKAIIEAAPKAYSAGKIEPVAHAYAYVVGAALGVVPGS